jgi:hypothetical protein
MEENWIGNVWLSAFLGQKLAAGRFLYKVSALIGYLVSKYVRFVPLPFGDYLTTATI